MGWLFLGLGWKKRNFDAVLEHVANSSDLNLCWPIVYLFFNIVTYYIILTDIIIERLLGRKCLLQLLYKSMYEISCLAHKSGPKEKFGCGLLQPICYESCFF